MKHVIDAKGKVPGRVATEVAVILMGKNRTDFSRNKVPNITVEVVSASKMTIIPEKIKSKNYYRHSGYPGGLKKESMEHVVKTKGEKEVLRRAVYGMLPKNKLRAIMMKNLIIKE